MYKAVLTHEILPGKLAELKAWFKQQDQKRRAQGKFFKLIVPGRTELKLLKEIDLS